MLIWGSVEPRNFKGSSKGDIGPYKGSFKGDIEPDKKLSWQ